MVAGVPTNAASSFGFGCLCDVPVHGASGVTGWSTMLINVRIKVPSNARCETLAGTLRDTSTDTGIRWLLRPQKRKVTIDSLPSRTTRYSSPVARRAGLER